MEDEAFLRGIESNPEDDTARLVYADWLDERDDQRGVFLRNVVALRNAAPGDASRSIIDHLLGFWSLVPAEWLHRVERDFAEDAVREVVFRYLLGDSPFPGNYLQVDEKNDPSAFLLALMNRPFARYLPFISEPFVQPVSEAEISPGGVFGKKIGQPGQLIDVSSLDNKEFHWPLPRSAEIGCRIS